jgi:hypothetical protein
MAQSTATNEKIGNGGTMESTPLLHRHLLESSSRFRECVKSLKAFVEAQPLLAAALVGLLKNMIADEIVQHFVERSNVFDTCRWLTFCLFGFFYVGMFQFMLFNCLLPKALSTLLDLNGHWRDTMGAVIFDQFVHIPFIYLPIFYAIRDCPLCSGHLDLAVAAQGVFDAWRRDVQVDCLAQWSFFIPLQVINFRYVSPYWRIPVLVCAGFFWVLWLSLRRVVWHDFSI